MKKTKKIPRIVHQILIQGGLLVGSQVGYLLGKTKEKPGDYDILVPFEKWKDISILIPEDAEVNSFRGWRFYEEGVQIDVWPGSVFDYLTNCSLCLSSPVFVLDFIHNRVYSSEYIKPNENT